MDGHMFSLCPPRKHIRTIYTSPPLSPELHYLFHHSQRALSPSTSSSCDIERQVELELSLNLLLQHDAQALASSAINPLQVSVLYTEKDD